MRAHVGRPELRAGLGGGERMAGRGVGKPIRADREVGDVARELRPEGLSKGLGSRAEVVAVTMDPTEIKSAVEVQLARAPDLRGARTPGPSAAEPALAALGEGRLVGRIQLGTFALSPTVPAAARRRDGLRD